MIKANYMGKLLDGVEVEWKPLGKIADLKRGRVMSKEYFIKNKGNYPVYSSRTVNNGMIGSINTFDFDGEYVNWTTDGANAGTVFYRTGKFSITNVSGLIKIRNTSELNYKFLFHWLSIEVKKHVYKGMGNPKLMSHQMEKVPVPIPPLKVQEEIVRILDTFTELASELTLKLTSELITRKKQYTYYLDKLLNFDEDKVEWKKLGDVGEFTRGKRFVKTDMLSEGFPCIHYGEMYTHYNIWAEKTKSFVSRDLASKLRVADHGDVVIVAAGETIEDIGKGTAWLGNTGVVIHDACFSYKSSLNPKYVSYFLHTKLFHDQIKKYISSGKISAINADGLSKAKIPIPPFEEQARIVSILDKFDVVISSINEELLRERDLRRKQYEYYRNMLLSFPKGEVKA